MYLKTLMKSHSIISLVGIAFALTLNALAIALPLNGMTTGELSDQYPNLFVPAGITFSIWSVIYLALISFVIYFIVQAFGKHAENPVLLATTPWFLISCLANGSWIVAWHYLKVELSLVIMLIMLFSLCMIFIRIRQAVVDFTQAQQWLVAVPFSIYLSWISVATIANTTTVVVHHDFFGLRPNEPGWTVALMSAAGLIAAIVAIKHRDTPYLLVLIWAFVGIYLKRDPSLFPEHQIITTACIVWLSILALLAAFVVISPTPPTSRSSSAC